GFAITLFIGVALSMFTAIIITRTFLRLIVGGRLVTNLAVYGVRV
ncbi:MAG: protein translocase subunit SecD, partial [Chloroflexi bacterium CG_4_10_14_0_8_um_filter_46_9]